MDYTKLLNELDDATLFDLHRLRVAINLELDNPKRIREVKRMINIGDQISYFEDNENRLIQAEVIESKRTRLLVKNHHDKKLWNIPFYMINTENVAADISHSAKTIGLSRQEVKIGDWVGFRNDNLNQNIRGKIIRINPKTVSVLVEPNQKWRVSYSMLYRIVDEDKSSQNQLINGIEVVNRPPKKTPAP